MRLLSITAQKPNSTGSGVYLTELVKSFKELGHEQAVAAGVYKEDSVELPDGVEFHPVYFGSQDERKGLSFPIVGMSDEMPYKSTRYCDMTEEMAEQFKHAFLEVIQNVVEKFQPDIILCHHLYLLTAFVREAFPDRKVYGFCHNTDLRQMQKTNLRRDYIAAQIRALDRIFVPQNAQRRGAIEIYGVRDERITTLGMGYNHQIFFDKKIRKEDSVIRLIFAGKIAEKKGVISLIRSLSHLPYGPQELVLKLAGGTGNQKEYDEIRSLAEKCSYKVEFLGRLSQPELAEEYNACDIFVLPSFFDGLPLTIIEALACGDKVVVSELPGIREWIEDMVPGACVQYVTMPEMRNTDEPVLESLPEFEKRLAGAIKASVQSDNSGKADVSSLSWEGIAKKVLS